MALNGKRGWVLASNARNEILGPVRGWFLGSQMQRRTRCLKRSADQCLNQIRILTEQKFPEPLLLSDSSCINHYIKCVKFLSVGVDLTEERSLSITTGEKPPLLSSKPSSLFSNTDSIICFLSKSQSRINRQMHFKSLTSCWESEEVWATFHFRVCFNHSSTAADCL